MMWGCGGQRTTFDNQSSPFYRELLGLDSGYQHLWQVPYLPNVLPRPCLTILSHQFFASKERIKHDVPILWMGIILTRHRPQHPSAEGFGLLHTMNVNGFSSKRAMWWK